MTEKPLAAHMPSSESYGSEQVASRHPKLFDADQSRMQVAAIPTYGSSANQTLPAIDTMSVTDATTLRSSTNQAVKQEANTSPDQHRAVDEDLLESASSSIAYPPLSFDAPGDESSFRHGEGAGPTQYNSTIRTVASSHPGPGSQARSQVVQVVQHVHNPNFNILLPNQRGGKRGPFRDPSLREQTAQTRRIGSCIRCRMQRIRVSARAFFFFFSRSRVFKLALALAMTLSSDYSLPYTEDLPLLICDNFLV